MHSSSPNPSPSTISRSNRHPIVDEWGFYDPEQAGFAALADRIEEKWRTSGDVDGERIAASMHEANRLAERSIRKAARLKRDEESPVRHSCRAFLP